MLSDGSTPRQKLVIAVRNGRDTPVTLILEPWASEFVMPPGAVYELCAEGPEGDCLQIDYAPDHIIAWGWSGSVVEVWHNGERLTGPSIPVPGVPPGMTVRGFLGQYWGSRNSATPIEAP
jgi:hypothetical protein